jgi:hypothetical protein
VKFFRKLIRYEGQVNHKYYTEFTFSYFWPGEWTRIYQIDNGLIPFYENIVEQLRDKYHMDLYKASAEGHGGGKESPPTD